MRIGLGLASGIGFRRRKKSLHCSKVLLLPDRRPNLFRFPSYTFCSESTIIRTSDISEKRFWNILGRLWTNEGRWCAVKRFFLFRLPFANIVRADNYIYVHSTIHTVGNSTTRQSASKTGTNVTKLFRFCEWMTEKRLSNKLLKIAFGIQQLFQLSIFFN